MTANLNSWIQTYNSHKFYPLDPDNEENEIDIEDIAHSLSMQCRFNGHTIVHYGVAQHSCEVCDLIWKETQSKELALWGLLHDAAEAYLSDIPKPIKKYLIGFQEAEDKLLKKIIEKFGLTWPQPDIVYKYDLIMLLTEQEWLMGYPPDEWKIETDNKLEALPVFPNLILTQQDSKFKFLWRFEMLTGTNIEKLNEKHKQETLETLLKSE